MKIITISREYGAGGREIGMKTAEALGIEFYDRDIISAAARESDIDVERIRREGEEISASESFLRSITPISYDQKDTIFEAQKQVVLSLAAKGPCVILGRCADMILTEAGVDSLNVFIHADEVHRAFRVGEDIGSRNPSDIARVMRRTDRARRAYYEHYTGARWGDCRNYTMTLDSGLLGTDRCVALICAVVRE